MFVKMIITCMLRMLIICMLYMHVNNMHVKIIIYSEINNNWIKNVHSIAILVLVLTISPGLRNLLNLPKFQYPEL